MGARAWSWLVCLALTCGSLACGGDDSAPNTAPRDTSKRDAALDPASKDAGHDAALPADKDAAMAKDAAQSDAAADAGPDAAAPDTGMTPEMTDAIPAEWSCRTALWLDHWCDCGCGAHDPDCPGGDCIAPGCVADRCDACFAVDGTWTRCEAPPNPSDRTCDLSVLSDAYCDCGCGIPDQACPTGGCTEPGCRKVECEFRHNCGNGVTDPSDDCSQLNPATLTGGDWRCPWNSYGGGDGCDCGCGALDPDCAGAGCTAPQCYQLACDRCNDQDGRPYGCDAAQGGWDDNIAVTGEASRCDAAHFNAGVDDGCDCGCGGHDPDCGDSAGCDDPGCSPDAACKRCTDGITGRPIGCAPQAWLNVCPPENYGTGDGCDCGCGAPDPDCAGQGATDPAHLVAACDVCHDGVGPYNAGTNYQHYIKCPNWTCPDMAAWGTAQCDCGCGAIDPYCRDANLYSCTQPGCTTAACDYCNDSGGVRNACTTHWSTGGATCNSEYYGIDGLCDCGCGVPDPDCGNAGCTEAGCTAPGCDVCHDGTSLAVCDPWYCDVASYDEGGTHHCDCGCGALDPDCAGGGCKDAGCGASACDVCHDTHQRVVNCP